MWLADTCLKLWRFKHRVLLWVLMLFFLCFSHGYPIYIVDIKLVLWTWIWDSIRTHYLDLHVWVIERTLFLVAPSSINHIDLLLQDDKAPLSCEWQFAVILLLQEAKFLICIFWAAHLRILPVIIGCVLRYLRAQPRLLCLFDVSVSILFWQ